MARSESIHLGDLYPSQILGAVKASLIFFVHSFPGRLFN